MSKPVSSSREIDTFYIEQEGVYWNPLSIPPISLNLWNRAPDMVYITDNSMFAYFKPGFVTETCSDQTSYRKGIVGGVIRIQLYCDLLPTFTIREERITKSNIKVRESYYHFHPYMSIMTEYKPNQAYKCLDKDESFGNSVFLRQIMLLWIRHTKSLNDVSSVDSSINAFLYSNDSKLNPYPIGCDRCIGDYAQSEFKDSELPLRSRIESDVAYWELAADTGLFDLAFKLYIGAMAVFAVGDIISKNIPDKVVIPFGCVWLEYELNPQELSISKATVWVPYYNCDGKQWARFEDYYDGLCFGIEWPNIFDTKGSPDDPIAPGPEEVPKDSPRLDESRSIDPNDPELEIRMMIVRSHAGLCYYSSSYTRTTCEEPIAEKPSKEWLVNHGKKISPELAAHEVAAATTEDGVRTVYFRDGWGGFTHMDRVRDWSDGVQRRVRFNHVAYITRRGEDDEWKYTHINRTGAGFNPPSYGGSGGSGSGNSDYNDGSNCVFKVTFRLGWVGKILPSDLYERYNISQPFIRYVCHPCGKTDLYAILFTKLFLEFYTPIEFEVEIVGTC